MKSYYSILRFVSNSLSAENLALGLVLVGEDASFIRLSPKKISFAKKLQPTCARLLSFALRHVQQCFSESVAASRPAGTSYHSRAMTELLDRLSRYHNGLLQFSKPACLELPATAALFDQYFGLLVEVPQAPADVVPTASRTESGLTTALAQQLYEPLRQQVDVDYTLRKKQLPSLFFDFHFDSLGVNGSVYAAKAVDFNSTRKLADIQRDISEYESVIERLNTFASARGITGRPHYYLIADPYQGPTPSYAELYAVLQAGDMPFFELATSADLTRIVRQVRNSHARKFSAELLAG